MVIKNNAKISKIVFLFIFVILMGSIGFFAQELDENDNLDDLSEEENIQEFIDAGGEDKNGVWRDPKAKAIDKLKALRNMADRLTSDRIGGDAIVMDGVSLGEGVFNGLFEGMDSLKIKREGFEFDTNLKDVKDLGKFAREKYGSQVDSRLLQQKVENFIGFEGLRWVEGEGAGNVIGDGNVWMDMERIPLGTKVVRYSEGRFIFERYDGTVMIVSGETDKKGNVLMKNMYGVSEENGEKVKEHVKINPFDVLIGGEGSVEITGEGFLFKGNAKVKYKNFLFSVKEGFDEWHVKISNNKFVLTGVGLIFKDHIIVDPVTKDFVVPIAGLNEMMNQPFVVDEVLETLNEYYESTGRQPILIKDLKLTDEGVSDLIAEIKDNSKKGGSSLYDIEEIGELVQLVRFEDITGSFDDVIEEGVTRSVNKYGEFRLYFNEDGEFTHYRKVGDDKWTDIKGADNGGGRFITQLIKESNDPNGERVDYAYVRDQFYNNEEFKDLKEDVRDITVERYQPNFAAVIGENVLVGGRGNIEILRDLNSLNAIESNSFHVKSGDMLLKFDGNKMYSSNKISRASFTIDSIQMQHQGRVEGFQINNEKSLSGQVVNENGKFVLESSNRLIAGREVSTLPGGASVDLYMSIPKKGVEDVNSAVDFWIRPVSYDRTVAIEALLENEFEFKADIYVPIEAGVEIDLQDQLRKAFPIIEGEFFRESFELQGVERTLKPSTIDSMREITLNSVEGVKFIGGGKITFTLRHNPGGDPSILISIPGNDLDPVKLEESVGLIREAATYIPRSPDLTKKTTSNWASRLYGGKPNIYWPPPIMKTLWYRNIGRGTRTGSYSDLTALEFVNRVTIPAADSNKKE
tara:strand:+ start:1209 stop:3785 length:2577 start_codon:yes stop_codon:yes gene_type:complete